MSQARSFLLFVLILCSPFSSASKTKLSVNECAKEVQRHLEQDPEAIMRALYFRTDLVQSFIPRLTPLQFWVLNILLERNEPTIFGLVGLDFQYRQFEVDSDVLESAVQRMERGGRLISSRQRDQFDRPLYVPEILGEWEHQRCHEFYKTLFEKANERRRRTGSRSVKAIVDKMIQPRSIIPKLGHTQAILLTHLSSAAWKTVTEIWEETAEYSTPTDRSYLYATLNDLAKKGFLEKAEVQVGVTLRNLPKYQTAYRTTAAGDDALARTFFFYVVLGDVRG